MQERQLYRPVETEVILGASKRGCVVTRTEIFCWSDWHFKIDVHTLRTFGIRYVVLIGEQCYKPSRMTLEGECSALQLGYGGRSDGVSSNEAIHEIDEPQNCGSSFGLYVYSRKELASARLNYV